MTSLIPGQWSACLCNVCAAGPVTCFTSFACPCVQYGLNNDRLKQINREGGDCCGSGCTYFLLMMVVGMIGLPLYCLPHSGFRKQVRHLNKIDSSCDCCITLCFPPCAMIQEAHLLTLYMTEVGPAGGMPMSPVRVVPIPGTPQPCNAVPSTPQSTPMVPARYPSPQVAVPIPIMTPMHNNQVVPVPAMVAANTQPQTPSQMQGGGDGHHKKDKDGKKKKKKGPPVNADLTPSRLPVAEQVSSEQTRPAQGAEPNMYGGYNGAPQNGLPPTGRQRRQR